MKRRIRNALLVGLSLGAAYGGYRLAGMFGVGAPEAQLPDLPLIEFPVARAAPDAPLVVLLSSDGGWARLDQELVAEFRARGIPTVGLNSLRYFVTPRTPEGATADLVRIVDHYRRAWGRDRVLLVGYSFGADALPFLVNRLPERLRGKVDGLVLLAFWAHASFAFTPADWLGVVLPGRSYPSLPEARRITDLPILCITGMHDRHRACYELEGQSNVTAVRLEAAHRLGEVSDAVAGVFFAWMRDATGRRCR